MINGNYQKPITLFGEFSSFKIEFKSIEKASQFSQKFNRLLNEDWFDRTFLYHWFPDYYHKDTIAGNDDLACYVHNEKKSLDHNIQMEWDKEIENLYNIQGRTKNEKINNALEVLNRYDKELYAEALMNYIVFHKKWPDKNYWRQN